MQEAQNAFLYAKQQGCLLMEAMKACFLPVSKQVKQWVDDKKIGEVKYIEAEYCSNMKLDETHRIHQKDLGGGSFYDIGIYPLAYINYMISDAIEEVSCMKINNHHGVDETAQMMIRYKDGVLASMKSSIVYDGRNDCMIYGTKGTIQIKNFWKSERATLFEHDKESMFEEIHQQSEFRYQIQHFIALLMDHKLESDIMSPEATIKNISLLMQMKEK